MRSHVLLLVVLVSIVLSPLAWGSSYYFYKGYYYEYVGEHSLDYGGLATDKEYVLANFTENDLIVMDIYIQGMQQYAYATHRIYLNSSDMLVFNLYENGTSYKLEVVGYWNRTSGVVKPAYLYTKYYSYGEHATIHLWFSGDKVLADINGVETSFHRDPSVTSYKIIVIKTNETITGSITVKIYSRVDLAAKSIEPSMPLMVFAVALGVFGVVIAFMKKIIDSI